MAYFYLGAWPTCFSALTVGKHALDAGADLVSVSALLGHQRLETTAIYTTPSQRDLERVVQKLEQDGSLH